MKNRIIAFLIIFIFYSNSLSGQRPINDITYDSTNSSNPFIGNQVVDSSYIIQLKLPPFNSEKFKNRHIKDHLSKSKKQKINKPFYSDEIRREIALIEVSHKRFLKDLAKIEAQLGISQKKDSLFTLIQGEYFSSLNGFSLKTSQEIIENLLKLKYVKTISPDRIIRVLDNESNEIIHADRVWNEFGSTGKDIVIGILDSGIDPNHQELIGRVLKGYDFVNNDNNAMDDHGHGTHCAGIAAANGPRLKGVAPDAKLLPIKVMSADGTGNLTNIIQGIEYAQNPDGDLLTDDKVDIISASIGGAGDPNDPLATAINNAFQNGVLCVVAAGNYGSKNFTVTSPGCAENALTVGATNKNDNMATFSSRGPILGSFDIKPDIVAPGVSILSTYLENSYLYANGTSMATPHVAGAAALLIELHPEWTPGMVKAALMQSAKDIGADILSQGKGRLDIFEALSTSFFVEPNKINYGIVDTDVNSWTSSTTINIYNDKSTSGVFTLYQEELLPDGIVLTFPNNVIVPAKQEVQIEIKIEVDNTVYGYPENDQSMFNGKITIESQDNNVDIDYSFIKGLILTIGFDKNPDLLCIHDKADFEIYSNVGGKSFYTILPGNGSYDVISIFDTYKTFVLKEDLVVNESTNIQINSADAIHQIELSAEDPSGNDLPFYTNHSARLFIHKASGNGIRSPFIISFIGQIPGKQLFNFSDVSNNYRFEITGLSYPFLNGYNKFFRLPYLLNEGIYSSRVLSYNSNEYLKVNYKHLFSESEDTLYTLKDFSTLGVGTMVGVNDPFSFNSNIVTVDQAREEYYLPDPDENYKTWGILQDRFYSYNGTISNYYDDTPISVSSKYSIPSSGGEIALFNPKTYSYSGLYLPVSDDLSIEHNSWPPFIFGQVIILNKTLKFNKSYPYFINPYLDHSNKKVEYSLTKENIVLSEGEIDNIDLGVGFEDVDLEEGDYKLEFSFKSDFSDDYAKAEYFFNSVQVSGFLTRFNILNLLSDGIPTRTFNPGFNNTISFELSNNPSNPVLFYSIYIKNQDKGDWTELEVIQNNNKYISELPCYMDIGSYDLRICISNTSLDSLSYTITNAFYSNIKSDCIDLTKSNWYFGNNAAMKFGGEYIEVKFDNQCKTNGYSVSMSDSVGYLLFYSDGKSVYDSNHNLINSEPLLGSTSDYFGDVRIITLPNPADENQYYLLYGNGDDYYYSLIDISENGVTLIEGERDILISSEAYVSDITAIPHNNNKDYWVIISHGYKHISIYLLSENGFELSYVKLHETINNIYSRDIAVSPNNSKVAISNYVDNEIVLYDFNNETGDIQFLKTILTERSQYVGLCFSPNSEFLYYCAIKNRGSDIFQYSYNNDESTLVSPEDDNYYTDMQLGPDGKIYVETTISSGINIHQYLSTINYPNNEGSNCEFVVAPIYLERNAYRLPSFINTHKNGSSTFSVLNAENPVYQLKSSENIVPSIMNPQSEIELYPNPAKDVAYLLSEEPINSIELIDNFGRVITSYRDLSINEYSIDLSRLSNGTYILRIDVGPTVFLKNIVVVR